MKIFTILYADDTVIISETEEGLQQALLNFEQYCDLWKLKVHTQKTKFLFSVSENTKHKYRLNYTYARQFSTIVYKTIPKHYHS
jgi:predicted nucleotidyltransferase